MSSTDWRPVEQALAAKLATVSISVDLGGAENFDQTVAQVYVDPPASIEPGLLPCIIQGDNPFDDEWDASLAIETYRVEAFLLLRDEDAEIAVQLAKAYRQSIRDVLRAAVKLGRSEVLLQGASYGPVGVVEYAGQRYPGFRFEVAVLLNDDNPGFAAG